MNIDSGFFGALLTEGDPRILSTVSRDWITPKWQIVYDFVTDCLNNPEVKRMPKPETVELRFNCDLMRTTEPVGFFVSELRKRKARLALEDGVRDILMPLISMETPDQNRPLEAADKMMAHCSEVKSKYRQVRQGEPLDYKRDIERRRALYRARKERRGLMGIPYPFEPLNICTGGLIDGELTLFLGEYGQGKTWFMNQVARHAFQQGHSVLFVSQEMGPDRAAIREDALMAGISPDRFRRGMLTEEEEERLDQFYGTLAEYKNEFLVYGPADVHSTASFEALISMLRPKIDVVLWDSPYLCIRSSTWEQRSEFVKGLKNMAESYSIPIFATWQLTHEGRAALTVAAATDPDHTLCLQRDQQMKSVGQAKIYAMKTRDGLELQDMMLQWDVARGAFDVLSYNIPGVESDMGDYAGDFSVEDMG